MEKARKIWILTSENERIFIQNVINQYVNKTSLSLFRHFKETTDKKWLFSLVFRAKWTQSNDYLIRNEFRLLAEAFRKIIVAYEGRSGATSDFAVTWLKWVIAKGDGQFFESEYKQALKKLDKHQDYAIILRIIRLRFDFLRNSRELSSDLFTELCELENSYQEYLKKGTARDFAESFQRLAFASRSLKAWHPGQEVATVPSTISISLKDDETARYFYIKGNTYHLTGENKIGQLGLCLDLLNKPGTTPGKNKSEKQIIYGTIGLENFFLKRYPQAVEYYKKALESFPEKINLPIVFNLVNALLKLRKFEEVESLLDQYQEPIRQSESVKYRYNAILCMTKIFAGKTKEAKALLDHDLSRRPISENFYYRFLFALVFWLEEEYDLALTEIINLKRMGSRNDPYTTGMREIGSLFSDYFRSATLAGRPKEKQVRLTAEKVRDFRNKDVAAGEDFLPLLWLRDRLEKELKAFPATSS